MKLCVIDMFAGIGGFSLGLHRTGGFETVAVAETDPYASKVLAKRFGVPNVGDVTTAEYPNADIICAGFPCQDISFAGAGAGLAGARSGLWREVVRAIRVVRPRFAILENVAALLNRGMGTVLGDLAAIGHDAEWHCIPAAAVGAPHRRDRIWIIANPGSEQHEGCRAPLSGEIAAELLSATSHSTSDGRRQGKSDNRGRVAGTEPWPQSRPGNDCAPVADADRERGCGGNTERQDAEDAWQPSRDSRLDARGMGQWAVEPDVGRVANGVPKRVDRLRCLGNAVVPQIPELLGRAILTAIGDRSPSGPGRETGPVHESPGAKQSPNPSCRTPPSIGGVLHD
jgi:DNA (cytosine-5)-methyltransferase 1